MYEILVISMCRTELMRGVLVISLSRTELMIGDLVVICDLVKITRKCDYCYLNESYRDNVR